MKKVLFPLAAIALILTSCGKFKKDQDNMITYAARYGQTVTIPTSDYEVVEVSVLERESNDLPYTSGELKYMVNGVEVAKIDFNHGDHYQALVKKGTNEETVSLGEDKGDKWDYDKVITEPLVYSEDCGYVVSGVIKFYKDGTWVATFDYGDGSCEDLITKYTEDNSAGYVFSMNDYPEFNK